MMNEQLLKTSGSGVLPARRKLRKTFMGRGGGGGWHHPLPTLYVRGLKAPSYL